MGLKIRTTELTGGSFGVKIDHETLLKDNVIKIYRVSFGKKSTYVDSIPITLEELEFMKRDIDKVLRDCKRIELQEEALKAIDFEEILDNA